MIGYLIPLAILLFSLGGVFFVVIRKMHSGAQTGEGGLVYPDFDNSAERDVVVVPSEDMDAKRATPRGGAFFRFMEKFFRKMSVRLMKLENWLSSVSHRLHEKSLQKKTSSKTEHMSAPKSDSSSNNGATFISMSDKNGEFDERYWLGIIKEEPYSPYPYKKLGEIYLAREDFREARWALKRALKLEPLDAETKLKVEGLRGKRTRRK